MSHHTDFINKLTELFQNHYQQTPLETVVLPASGSERRYVRFTKTNKETIIGAFNPDKTENNTFFYFTGVFSKNGLPVPEIIAVSNDKQAYLLKDLGATTLFDIINNEGHSERVKSLLKKTIEQLVGFHWQLGNSIDYSLCYAADSFNQQQIFSDLLYFKYYFVDPLQIHYNKTALLEDLSTWSSNLAAIRPQTFMYRDFQSRNIMVEHDEVSFIDYQGGMLGLPEYDLASLLWQARAEFPESWKKELLNHYFKVIETIPENPNVKETAFRKTYLECALLRMLQTLGAYGFRGLLQGKHHFLKSIAPALKQLAAYLEEYPQFPPYNELRKVLDALVRPEIIDRFATLNFPAEKVTNLKVHIFSFSYKKGIPDDGSAHGGGYVFDCRGILNPGRQDAYKKLTGKDKAVIDFLEHQTRMPEYMKGVFSTVDISVMDYLNRDFDALTVSFGCTGGQHRSVYAAETLAKHLKEQFGILAEVIHVEQEQPNYKRR